MHAEGRSNSREDGDDDLNENKVSTIDVFLFQAGADDSQAAIFHGRVSESGITYDNGNNRLEINEPEILLIKEFKALSDRDKTKNKSRLWKELTYIYLAIDWKSLYS